MIEENDVPDNWSIKTIEEILVNAKNGGTPKRSNDAYWGGEIEWLSSGEIFGKEVHTAEETITETGLNESSAKIFEEDSVLVAMYGDGDTKGRSVINRTRISGNQAICCLVPDKNMMYEEYLLYYIKNIKNDLRELARGAGQDNLNQSLIINRRIPVPPLDEQERIVEAVKERLERMERLKKSVENVGRHAREYRDSLIEYLFTGREDLSTPSPNQIPTEDDVPKGWDIQTIGEISSQIRTGGTPKKSEDDFWGGDIPWKASKHFNENSLQLSDSSEHVTDKGKSESTMANPDDVVIVCRGAHTGKVGLAQSNFLFNQDVKVIRLPESVHSEFVAHYLSNHTEYFLQKQRGGTTKGITTRHVKNLRIPIPPLEQQRDIVAELKSIDFSRVSKAVSDVSRHFNEYRSSVLAHAFSGQIDC